MDKFNKNTIKTNELIMTVIHSHFFILWPDELIAVAKAIDAVNLEKLTDALMNFPQPEISSGGPEECYGQMEYCRKFMEFNTITLPPLYYLASFFVDPLQDCKNISPNGPIASHVFGSLCKQDLALLGVNIKQKEVSHYLPDGPRFGSPAKAQKVLLFSQKLLLFDFLNKMGMPFHYNHLSIPTYFENNVRFAGITLNPFNYLLEQLNDSLDTNPKECNLLLQKAFEMGVKPDDQTSRLYRKINNKPEYPMLSELMSRR